MASIRTSSVVDLFHCAHHPTLSECFSNNNRPLTARSRLMVELNTQDMLLSGDSQQLRRREQKFQWGRIVCRPLQEIASKNEKPKLGHSGLKMHPTCGVNTPCKHMCKISRCGKRRRKEEGRRKKERRRKKEEWRKEKKGRQRW